MPLTDAEYNLMRKARTGCDISRDEQPMAYELERCGLLNIGYQDDKEPFCETASLTTSGREVFLDERVLRNPLRRVLSGFLAPL